MICFHTPRELATHPIGKSWIRHWLFCQKCLGRWWRPTNIICYSMWEHSEVVWMLKPYLLWLNSFELLYCEIYAFMCHSWLLGITKYSTVRWWVYDDLVETYIYYDIVLWWFSISTSWAGTSYYSCLVVHSIYLTQSNHGVSVHSVVVLN